LGGRAFTSRLAGTEVELGGGFVHWFQPHVFAELTRYGIDFAVPPEPARWSYITRDRSGTARARPDLAHPHHQPAAEPRSILNDLAADGSGLSAITLRRDGASA
jgi:hypothetical protein